MSINTSFLSKLVFEYSPKDLEKKLPPEFNSIKMEILESLEKSNIFKQHFVNINQIVFNLEKNEHMGHDTYKCKILLDTNTNGADFVHVEEGKDYLHNIREATEALISFVLKKKNELEKATKKSNIKEF